MIKLLINNKGITLIEILITISLIGIVLIIIYNIYFVSIRNYGFVSNEVEANRELGFFLNNIQKEISQAKKANDNYIDGNENNDKEGPIFIRDNKYFCIYVDLDNDGKPYLVQYYLDSNKLMRRQCKTRDEEYPYVDYDEYSKPKVVLSNLDKNFKIDDIFRDIKIIEKEADTRTDYTETRKSVTLRLKIKDKNSKIKEYEHYLFTKSKAEFE